MCEKSVLDSIPHTQHCPICVGVNPVIVAPPTTYINHTSIQHQFKTGIPQGGVSHPHYLTFTLQTYHHPEHRFRSWPTQMTSPSHLHTQATRKYIQPYLHKVLQNHLTLNPERTTCTLFTPDPMEITSNLDLKINNTALLMPMHPNILDLILDPQLKYSTHMHNISVHAHKPLQII